MKWMTALAALLIAAAMTFAACGDDDDEGDGGGGQSADAPSEPAQLTITASDASVDAPGSTAPGVTEITFQNDRKKPASVQLIRAEGGRSQDEVIKTYNAVGESGKLPAWIIGGGGTGTIPPGDSTVVTQELDEGQYYAFAEQDEGGKASKKTVAVIEVSGEPVDAELPEAQTVTASEYTFETDTLTAGEPVAFENVGQQPHHLIAAPLTAGTTIKEAEKYFKSDGKGPPPLDFEALVGTAVLDSDQTVVSDLGLKKGKYAFLCFISDREGGPEHVAKGMIVEATVE